MMHRTAVIGGAALTLFLAAHAAFADDDPRVRSLRSHAVRFRSIEPEDDDFSDLEPLKKLLGEARIVQLGEQSHGDSATFHAKTRLIRFLHQEMGFDVIAFESGLYDCRKAWERFQAGADPQEAAEMGIFGIWTRSDQVRPLLNYIAQTARTDRPLELCGFDCQFTGLASHTALVPDLQAFLNSLPDQPVYRENGAVVIQAIGRIRKAGSAPTAHEQQRALAAFETLRKALADAKSTAAQPAAELEFWRQFLKSTAAFAQIAWARSSDRSGLPLAEQFNPRDAQMGDNMIWLARERYPQRKIIVWGATMHLLHNPHRIDTRRADLDYAGVEPMGQHLKEALGDEVFTIGFTAYEGQAGVPWGQPWRIDPAPAGSLEDLCVRAGLENAFLNFRGGEVPQWLRQPLVSRPLGHSPMEADWPQVIDGMVFTRTMTPSTRKLNIPALPAQIEEQQAAARDLLANVQAKWKRAQERIENGQPYADKVTFGSEYEQWRKATRPSKEQITAMRKNVTDWFESQPSDPGLTWRMHDLLALMLAGEGRRKEAHRELDAALESYPETSYAQPEKQSFFQHLVNRKAMLLWDDEGLDAALAFATQRLATDARCHSFFYLPWIQRLKAEENSAPWPTIRAAAIAAYEQRATKFPDEAKPIGARADELKAVGDQ